MTAEEVEEAILRLPPAELAKFRAWFADFEVLKFQGAAASAALFRPMNNVLKLLKAR